MSADSQRLRGLFCVGNVVAALAVSACLLAVLGTGLGKFPALGRALVPTRGAWASAAGARLPNSQSLTVAGLTDPVQVTFTAQGLAAIRAQTDDDAYTALGYVQAEFRLEQMDLERRVAEGRLAQLIGPSGVPSDVFELRLGLLRTAQQEWAQLPAGSPAAQTLVAYARGVNDYLAQARASGRWPAEFSLADVYPPDWTPVDSLAVQGELTQEFGFSTTPLDYLLLERSLGATRTQEWLGPSATATATAAAMASASVAATASAAATAQIAAAAPIPVGLERAAAAILTAARAASGALGTAPATQIGSATASTAWAANGPKVAGGGALLAGSPDLPLTMPSTWYQVALAAPGLAVSGVTVPGLPAVLIGHNEQIAWSLAAAAGQDTLYYSEQTRQPDGTYFWHGRWRRPRVLRYTIPVRGGPTRQLAVAVTAQGPVLTTSGRTVSVYWTGALGSPDVAALLGVAKASDFSDFASALAGWRSPDLTFVYADAHGNIGAATAGQDARLKQGQPWLPLPGDGADDVAGLFPAASGPPSYDPASHVVVAGGAGAASDPVTGYLAGHPAMTAASFAALQADAADPIAAEVLPRLLAALRKARLTDAQRAAEHVLASWNGQMTAASSGAVIWWQFWNSYLTTVFQPWWSAAGVPVSVDQAGLSIGAGQPTLDADLAAWTAGDDRNSAFSPPQPSLAATQRFARLTRSVTPAAADMRAAYRQAVNQLSDWMGSDPRSWQFGKVHTAQLPSLTGASALDYGPAPAGGDDSTVNAAVGWLNSELGQSVRVILGWPAAAATVAQVSYPGGQSENPASPWYADQTEAWRTGAYLSMPWAAGSGAPITWELRS
jgi:penicillin G amidase